MAAITLVATVLTGLLLLAVALGLARGIEWRSNEIFAEKEGSVLAAVWNWARQSPLVWVLVFLGVTFGLVGASVAVFLGIEVLGIPFFELVLAGLGLLALSFLVVGTYAAARDRDVSPAGASLAASLVVGALLLVGIAAQLLVGF